MPGVSSKLHRFVRHPAVEAVVGLLVLGASVAELLFSMEEGAAANMGQAGVLLGGMLLIRAAPSLFLGVELLDEAERDAHLPVSKKGPLHWLDSIAHSRGLDLLAGGILVAVGFGGVIESTRVEGTAAGMRVNLGILAFGLAPFVDALIALFKGFRRLDREGGAMASPVRGFAVFALFDRVMKNCVVWFAAGALMLGGGVFEFVEFLHLEVGGKHFHLSAAMLTLGAYTVASALPELYEGLRLLASSTEKK